MKIEEDEILGRFFDTPEKKAKWIKRIFYLYLAWIVLFISGLIFWLIKVLAE
ncbi:MAG: hypothetical protein H5T44_01110 [Thermoplasmatales archaeon]|nr:hypothetical protein [Thermoplasmatales archaeon]